MKPTSPSLLITQQDSLAKLLLTTKTGVPRDVHVVVKNTPFNVVLGISKNLPPSHRDYIDLSKCTISVGVHYDSDDPTEGKQVKLMTSKPCEYKVHLSDKRSDEASLEVRMKVLTSQHEDMLFRLHIAISNDNGTSPVLRTTTAAIKVVSKPDQVRRINGEKGKKRTHADMVNESLERIEQRQQQQQALLMKVLKSCSQNNNSGELRLSSSNFSLDDLPSPMRAPPSTTLPTNPRPTPNNNNNNNNTTEKLVSIPVPTPTPKSSAEDMSFEAAFALCMKKYAALPTSERPAKMRKIVSASSSRDARSIFEFSDALRSEGLRNIPDTKPHIVPPTPAPTQQQQQQQQQQPTPPPTSTPPMAPSMPLQKTEPHDAFLPEFPPLSSSLSFSDPSMTTDFVHDMFQNALSPFHF